MRPLTHSLLTTRGQALLELAIFGSLIIMILGVLVNYGLNADYTQQSMMQSFRQALKLAPEAGSASVVVINDRYVPNPSDPFAASSAIPISATAQVVQNFRMHETADSPEELPKLTLQVNGATRQYALSEGDNICDGQILDLDAIQARCQEDSSPWCCSKLDELFPNGRRMGLQPGFTKKSQVTKQLDVNEGADGLTTASRLTQRDTVTRTVITKPLGQAASSSEEAITSTPKDATTESTWKTGW